MWHCGWNGRRTYHQRLRHTEHVLKIAPDELQLAQFWISAIFVAVFSGIRSQCIQRITINWLNFPVINGATGFKLDWHRCGLPAFSWIDWIYELLRTAAYCTSQGTVPLSLNWISLRWDAFLPEVVSLCVHFCSTSYPVFFKVTGIKPPSQQRTDGALKFGLW